MTQQRLAVLCLAVILAGLLSMCGVEPEPVERFERPELPPVVIPRITEVKALKWISWKDNTYPGVQDFEIREEGKYPGFGTIKVEYDLKVMPGQLICARVDADNERYGWYVMVYYGANLIPGAPRTELGSYQSIVMFEFGNPDMPMRAGEWRCQKVPPIFRYATQVPGPYTVFKAHWCGFGKGGVVARPMLVVKDRDVWRHK